jgi:protein involved in polysaccharide export with SLBB domain
MSTESQLREKLRKIEALFAGAGTAGERLAAEAALERVRERLTELGRQDPSIEMRFLMPDQWSRHLFLAAVEVAQYRPFAIMGDVQKPGQYPYRPGLTVLEAISLAGGYYRPELGLLRRLEPS